MLFLVKVSALIFFFFLIFFIIIIFLYCNLGSILFDHS